MPPRRNVARPNQELVMESLPWEIRCLQGRMVVLEQRKLEEHEVDHVYKILKEDDENPFHEEFSSFYGFEGLPSESSWISIYDQPVYDEEKFVGILGVKSSFENVWLHNLVEFIANTIQIRSVPSINSEVYDSLTSRWFRLSSNEQFDNDGKKIVSKHIHSSVTTVFSQAAIVASATTQNAAKSELLMQIIQLLVDMQMFKSVLVGFGMMRTEDLLLTSNHFLNSLETLVTFFENSVQNFCEPPGTNECQVIVFTSVDCGDISGIPCIVGIDILDKIILVVGLASCDTFNQPSSTFIEDTIACLGAKAQGLILHQDQMIRS